MEKRELKESLVYQDLQETLDWLVCQDPWDQLGLLALQDLQDQLFVLDLMTWRAPVGASLMHFQVSEDQKDYRVLLAYLDTQVNPDCLAYQVQRETKVLQEEMDSQDWTASLDLRDKRVTEATLDRGVNQVEMEQVSRVHRVHLDHQDKSSISRLTTLMPSLAESALRGGLVYLEEQDFLVLLDQRETEVTLAHRAME